MNARKGAIFESALVNPAKGLNSFISLISLQKFCGVVPVYNSDDCCHPLKLLIFTVTFNRLHIQAWKAFQLLFSDVRFKNYRLCLGRGSELLFLKNDRQNLFTLKLLPNVFGKTEHFPGELRDNSSTPHLLGHFTEHFLRTLPLKDGVNLLHFGGFR